MTGTQKMAVAIVAIVVVGAVAIGAVAILGKSESASPAESQSVSSGVTAPSPSHAQPTPSTTPDKLERLREPWAVHASIVSDTRVRVEWKAEGAGVRYFQVLDGGRPIGGHISASKRQAEFDTSYGTHCFRVVAIAEAGKGDSSASACGSVTVSRPSPPGSRTGSCPKEGEDWWYNPDCAGNFGEKAECEASGGEWDKEVGGCLAD